MKFRRASSVGAAFLSLVLSTPGFAKDVDVFFAGGQSNAKTEWGDAIRESLEQSGAYQNVILVHVNHPGNWLNKWYLGKDTPQNNYYSDFSDGSGGGLLASTFSEIRSQGDSPSLRGFFWFQGEGDTGNYSQMDTYQDRFNWMLDAIRSDLGLERAIQFTLAVIDANPDPRYDDPAEAAGRERAQIEYMRRIHAALGGQGNGNAVDSRGYERRDLWHLPPSALERLGKAMAESHVRTFAPRDTATESRVSQVSPPGYLRPGSNAEIELDFSSRANGELNVHLLNKAAGWSWHGMGALAVTAGSSGRRTIELWVPEGTPDGVDYVLKSELRYGSGAVVAEGFTFDVEVAGVSLAPAQTVYAWGAGGSEGVGLYSGWGFGEFDPGDWVRYDDVDLSSGYNQIAFRFASGSGFGGALEVRLDSVSGALAGVFNYDSTGGWNTFRWRTARLDPAIARGRRDVFLVAKSGALNLTRFRLENE